MSQDWRALFGTIDVSPRGLQANGLKPVPQAATTPVAPSQPAANSVVAQTSTPPAAVAQATAPPTAQPQQAAQYPSYWTMAQTFTASAAQFVANGAKPVSREVREERLSICKMCPQYDGTRCIQCGCFIAAKTWVPHEKCPAGKWPT